MHSNATYRGRVNILKHPNRLYVRLPPRLAPAARLGAAHLHRPEPARPGNPVAPARRSAVAQAKASRQHDPADSPIAASTACWSTWPPWPSAQREAFTLLGTPIPLTLT